MAWTADSAGGLAPQPGTKALPVTLRFDHEPEYFDRQTRNVRMKYAEWLMVS